MRAPFWFVARGIRTLLVCSALVALTGCDTGLRQMGPTEYGIIFRNLPPLLGGGVSRRVVPNAQKVIVFPWDTVYRFDTSEQYVTWGAKSGGGFVYTRARDGNEVALAVTVVYRIVPDGGNLQRMISEGATSNDEVRALVTSIGRADIRTFMNHLRTAEFASVSERYQAVSEVKRSINSRLEPYGIEILRVTLDDFQFERLLRDGTVDSSYQEKLTQIQKLQQDTSREVARIETIKARKQKEYNETQASVKRSIEEAEGYLTQAKLRGDAYFQARSNEAKGISARGEAEVKGILEQVEALSGPGGEGLLRLEIARQLMKGDPRFIVQSETQAGIDVRRMDTNQLLSQIGVLEGLAAPATGAGAKK